MNIHHGTCQSAVRWVLDQAVLKEGHVSQPPPNGTTTPQRVEQGNSDANDGRDVTC
ncbi:unnamed protein product [Leuciscus chuanchicus]